VGIADGLGAKEAAMTADQAWHTLPGEQVAEGLGTDTGAGLSQDEATARLAKHGINDIAREKGRGPLRIFASQFTDFMILVLLTAAVISGILGEPVDAVAIIVIVILNAAVGALQEHRAQRAVEALRRMAAPEARVIRNGETRMIRALDVVPGDLILLEPGDVVAADLRLLETENLAIDESALTGESVPVEKSEAILEATDLPVGDRLNMAHKATFVGRGKAKAVAVATGQATEIGRIADLLSDDKGVRTPLQQRLTRFGRHLALGVLAICTVIFFVGLLQGQPPLLMFLTAVTLAVAAVPEALPAVITVSLALGARKLSRRKALVRRLPAVETLGSVTFVCADKTGTLTENRMSVGSLATAEERLDSIPRGAERLLWRRLGEALALNNEVRSTADGLVGDPTEVALYIAAQRAGFEKTEIMERLPQVGILSFDAERKLMTTLHRENGGIIAFAKGAPETVIATCDGMLSGDEKVALDKDSLLDHADSLASEGYRVLALGCRELPEAPADVTAATVETGMTFLGLVGLIDPPRAEAPQAVEDCKAAGIVPVMITGDHPDTALSVARRLGIAEKSASVLAGPDLKRMSDEELVDHAQRARVYARVDPEQKIRIVRALQDAGEFVAMTGDGVNDAPALKRANIGVAMGERGTDVAREAADMVLLDDNFATIVAAVREGRRIYDDIRKFIKYTMTSNSGEIWTLFLAPFLGLPIPLLPIQILWINLVTDGLPGLAFSAEPAERGVMQRPPRPPNESIFAHGMWQHMLWVGLLIGALSISAQAWGYARGVEYWQTMVFTTLVIAQLFHALAIRSSRDPIWRVGITTNPHLLGAIALTVAAQFTVIYVPALNPIFKTAPLPIADLLTCFALGSLVLAAVEAEKWLRRQGYIYVERGS
jgi:Ca2+-transporting ATPase